MLLLLGFAASSITLENSEITIISSLQSIFGNNIVIGLFSTITYLGDFYVWIVFTVVYFLYARFRSNKYRSSSFELIVFMLLITSLTYFFKLSYHRPRPYVYSSSIIPYSQEYSFSYPSGHVSRCVGGFLIVSKQLKINRYLLAFLISLLSLSRMVLGVHYLTDAVGAVFLSLFTQQITAFVTRDYSKANHEILLQ